MQAFPICVKINDNFLVMFVPITDILVKVDMTSHAKFGLYLARSFPLMFFLDPESG